MDSLEAFMRETYTIKPDSRITVKEIYEDFRAWIIAKFGISVWNNITQRQVYAGLKELPNYAYVRYREGYCLKGIAYKSDKIQNQGADVIPKDDGQGTNMELKNITYLTLNIARNPGTISGNGDLNIPVVETPLVPTIETLAKDIRQANGGNIIEDKVITLNILPVNVTQNPCQEVLFQVNNTRTAPRVPQIIMPRAFK